MGGSPEIGKQSGLLDDFGFLFRSRFGRGFGLRWLFFNGRIGGVSLWNDRRLFRLRVRRGFLGRIGFRRYVFGFRGWIVSFFESGNGGRCIKFARFDTHEGSRGNGVCFDIRYTR